MPRYSTTPSGLKPEQRCSFPRTRSRLATAPTATARAVLLYERDGKRHAALFHNGQWMKVIRYPRDPHSGQVRTAMDGTTVIKSHSVEQQLIWLSP